MSPELTQAITERVSLGHTKEQIAIELQAAGYDDSTIEAAYSTAIADVSSIPPASAPGQLIGYWELVSDTFTLIKTEWQLIVTSSLYVLGLTTATGALIFAIWAIFSSTPGIAVMLVITVAIAAIVSFFALTFGFQRALLLRREQVAYVDHVRWTVPNIIGILLVSLYIQFATSLGYLFLFIPGVIAAIYLTYALLIRVAGNETGVMALVRSTQLVYGRWWGVLGRTLFTGIIFLLCTVPLFVVTLVVWGGLNLAAFPTDFAMISNSSLVNLLMPALLALLFLVAILFVAFLVQCSTILLFESLRDTAKSFTPAGETKLYFWMRVVVVLGIPAMILLNVADYYSQENDTASDLETLLQDPTAFQLEATEEQAAAQAELEAFMKEFESELEAN